MSNNKNISWNPSIDPETEDRLAFLKLSSQEKWKYMMGIVLANYPKKEVTYAKRIIEWT